MLVWESYWELIFWTSSITIDFWVNRGKLVKYNYVEDVTIVVVTCKWKKYLCNILTVVYWFCSLALINYCVRNRKYFYVWIAIFEKDKTSSICPEEGIICLNRQHNMEITDIYNSENNGKFPCELGYNWQNRKRWLLTSKKLRKN